MGSASQQDLSDVIRLFRTRVRLFRTRIRLVRTRIRLVRTRVRLFRTRVRLFRTRVRLFRSRVRLFRSWVRLFRSRVRLFRSQVRLFRSPCGWVWSKPVGRRPRRPNPFPPGRGLEHADRVACAQRMSFRTRACGRRRQSRENEGPGYMNKAHAPGPLLAAEGAWSVQGLFYMHRAAEGSLRLHPAINYF